MSYILEALKKSQQERGLGQVPTLDASGLFVEDREPQVTHHWALLAVGLAALAVVIALYAAFRDTRAVPMTMLDAPRMDPAPMIQPLTVQPPPAVTEAPGADPIARPLVEPPPPKPSLSRPSAPTSQTTDADVDPEWEHNLLRQLDAEQAAMNAAREILEEAPRVPPVPEDLVEDIRAFKQQLQRERE
jgi:general secretion pathway protein B